MPPHIELDAQPTDRTRAGAVRARVHDELVAERPGEYRTVQPAHGRLDDGWRRHVVRVERGRPRDVGQARCEQVFGDDYVGEVGIVAIAEGILDLDPDGADLAQLAEADGEVVIDEVGRREAARTAGRDGLRGRRCRPEHAGEQQRGAGDSHRRRQHRFDRAHLM